MNKSWALLLGMLGFSLCSLSLPVESIAENPAPAFVLATKPYHFNFPRDHGAHPDYRLEWWYVTGHLQAKDGHIYGYEVTFFREGIRPGDPPVLDSQSKWRTNQVYPAHFALTDITNEHFVSAGRFARGALNLAGASQERLAVHVGSWSMQMNAVGNIEVSATTPEFSVQLTLHPDKPVVIEGPEGVSRKGSCASCGSHYYSYTRLTTVGSVTQNAVRQSVMGLSWMDHEFGSKQISPDVVGWDWFSLMLDDGREVMIYRLRRKDGTIITQSSATIVAKDGTVRYLKRDEIQVVSSGSWRSPKTQTVYPNFWDIRIPELALHLQVVPQLADQELVIGPESPVYWEGACLIQDRDGRRQGEAYVEMTGYAAPVGPL